MQEQYLITQIGILSEALKNLQTSVNELSVELATLQDASSSGSLSVAACMRYLGTYPTITVRNNEITSPAAGMVIYLTATNKMQLYNGAEWVELN